MNELDWLVEHRPETDDPDPEAARRALLLHARRDRRELSPRRPRRGLTFAAAAAFVAVAAVVAVSTLPAGDGPARLGTPEAVAAPLVRLSNAIQQEPEPTGDATLVLRTHEFPDGKEGFTGADLYLDSGRYFYAQTRKELRGLKEDTGSRAVKREINAAVAALELPPAEARARMITATFDGHEPPKDAPQPAAALAEKRKNADVGDIKPASQKTMDENRIWIGAMDAVIAGAGRSDVRAGVLKLLATVDTIRVREEGDTLSLTATDFGDGYEETIVVDAHTGVITTMTGGYPGKEPSVVVTYEIKRVEAREIL